MSDEIQKELLRIIDGVPGLLALVISDRDGVPAIKASKDGVPETALRPSLLSAMSTTAEQGCKIGSGKCHAVVCEYKHFQVVIINRSPSLVMTLVASSNANMGLLLKVEETLSPIVEELSKIVGE